MDKNKKNEKNEFDEEIIFVASFYHKSAKRRIYAREFGKKAIPIKIKKTKPGDCH